MSDVIADLPVVENFCLVSFQYGTPSKWSKLFLFHEKNPLYSLAREMDMYFVGVKVGEKSSNPRNLFIGRMLEACYYIDRHIPIYEIPEQYTPFITSALPDKLIILASRSGVMQNIDVVHCGIYSYPD